MSQEERKEAVGREHAMWDAGFRFGLWVGFVAGLVVGALVVTDLILTR